ncbi:MAG: dTMP kinase, partial [Candidatus Omnitrophica bacterium]|nr:dTMP kinase [Candidatus Omnitrophota bacterium]
MKGVFITFEGSEGSGKSTQAAMICKYLKDKGRPALHLREPGVVKISETIRRILLDVRNSGMTKECETLLYMAARAQLVEEKVLPALKQGQVVLCDRFLDSTVAYQGYGNGVDINFIKDIGRMVTQGLVPDLTFLFDIETEKGLERTGQNKDRIELRSLHYHNRVRKGYLRLAQEEPGRIKIIRVNKSKEDIHALVKKAVDALLGW